MTEFSQSATPEHGARMALEGCGSVLWHKWRALRDSNPCFRRERAARASIGVYPRSQYPRFFRQNVYFCT
jgi:hypothetical protein